MHWDVSHTFADEAASGPSASDGAEIGLALSFGGYVALPSARTLLLDGHPVCIGARAFDLLVLLLAERGRIVRKEEIMRHVWPTTTVDESNLRFQVTCLRRTLGKERERIKTITGRGYLFVPEEACRRAAGSARRAEPAPEIPRVPRRPAIFVIDEDPSSREALRRLLQPLNACVSSFASLEAFRDSVGGAGFAATSH